MAAGSYVFGPNRVGLWIIPNVSLADKLRHVLPKVRVPLPNLTDIFLPPEATVLHKDICRQNGFFVSTYDVVHNTGPEEMAAKMLKKRRDLGTGALEIDLEGMAVQPDKPAMANWANRFVAAVRKTNPNLPIRLNVPPFKGYALPITTIVRDPHLHVIAQAYFGNQDGRCSEADVLLDLLQHGVPGPKAQVMYGALCDNPQNVRVYSLPHPGYKPITTGSVFSDDLMMDAGLIA